LTSLYAAGEVPPDTKTSIECLMLYAGVSQATAYRMIAEFKKKYVAAD
jgi:hypothetical protein